MSNLTGNQIRQKYLEFFKKRGHVEVPSASLVPQNDPTTLFTSSGMQPMIAYFLGEAHPEGDKIVDSQRCFRAEDIEEVGDNRHTTAFEMLGNWSLGDYFKKDQLNWFFEFLTKEIGLDPKKLYVSVFKGNTEIPRDTEAIEIWKEIFAKVGLDAQVVEDAPEKGMQGGRIFLYPEKKNWWSRSGPPSKMPAGEPGGPDSEVFFEFDQIQHDLAFGPVCHVNCDCGRYLEIGNSVFMQYQKQDDGSFKELLQKNIDFGGGLERILAASYNSSDAFVTDLFYPIIQKIEQLASKKYEGKDKKSFQIIADHIKAAVWLASDGVIPSNKAQGYMMRRLIRRSVSAGLNLTINTNFTGEIIPIIQEMYKELYPNVNTPEIHTIITEEESKFRKTLSTALKEATRVIEALNTSVINSEEVAQKAFDLYQSNGLPSDIFLDELDKKVGGLTLDQRQEIQEKFTNLFKAHQDLSRASSAGMFKGGLADHSEIVTQYHTTTHLLHQALRTVLGDHVFQKGSNITAERLRFDFSHSERLTEEQKQKVEQIVNQKIKESLPVYFQIMPLEAGRKTGAIGLFGEKYPDTVKVYSIGPQPKQGTTNKEITSETEIVPRTEVYSREFCGGPHVDNTHDIHGIFKIQKDEKIAKDVVRIKAVLQ
jgi:alanyl-tRNA synthetase